MNFNPVLWAWCTFMYLFRIEIKKLEIKRNKCGKILSSCCI